MNTKDKKLKRASIANLIGGYLLAILFGMLIAMGVKKPDIVVDDTITKVDDPFVETNTTLIKQEIVYDSLPRVDYVDRLNGIIIDDPDNVYTAVVNDDDRLNTIDVQGIYNRDHNRVIDHDTVVDRVGIAETHVGGNRGVVNHGDRTSRVDESRDDVITFEDATRTDQLIDPGLLDRRLQEIDEKTDIGLDTKDGLDIGKLTPVTNENESELGNLEDFDISADGGYGVGKGGQLYAYDFPSRGIGAGVGSSSLGASGGAGAGLGAGIGQGVLNGSTVPTLGGVGTYTTPGADGAPGSGGGVGGLVGGAGAGGAAGLYTGQVTPGLGIGPGGPGAGGYGAGGRYDFDHLPEDGALHIMMHVDGSGSILRTRKQLEIMKDTLLKEALLPYYDNDESLYNRRVTIVDGSGERTLKFFTKAAQKDNVLAVVFQDEAQPDYHLPNFNKKPEDHYSDDLQNLKASLNGYQGLYRGVMFQVGDKVFSKSFKEFVENAWRGEGYLKNENLSKYYWQENKNNIARKNGVVFSDEYHANPTGDSKYYLDLIFSAAKKVGLDLNIQAAGLTDGKKVNK